MKILVAPNAFKGSLGCVQAARAMGAGVRDALPEARVELMPVADGGDGLLDAWLSAVEGRRVTAAARGPSGERRRAVYGLSGDTALIEMARASGLALVPKGRLDPMRASSYGTGELIAHAVARGARRVIVGMGGSASNDGGAGMAQALGARLLDAEGRELPRGAAALLGLARVDASAPRARLKGVRIIALSDVVNPLLGPRGSARVFGPQKGATPAMVARLERALARYAAVLESDLGISVAAAPGAGAAGGLGAGLLAFCRARIVPGAAFVLDAVGAARQLRGAAAVLTGEGRLDATSFFGKAPLELARLARRGGVRAAFVCGQIDERVRSRLPGPAVSFREAGARGRDDSMRRASLWARRGAAEALLRLGLAALLCAGPAVATPSLAGEVSSAAAVAASLTDEAYFSRHEPGGLERSIERAESGLKDRPDDAQLLWRLGRSLIRRSERVEIKKEKLELLGRAEKALRRSVELSPDFAESQFWLGVALGRIGQSRGMIKSLGLVGPIRRQMERTLALDSRHGGAHHALGEMLRQLPRFAGGSKKKALWHFEQAVRLAPRYTANHGALARAYLDAGRREEAIGVLRQLLETKAPTDPAEFPQNAADAQKLLSELGAR